MNSEPESVLVAARRMSRAIADVFRGTTGASGVQQHLALATVPRCKKLLDGAIALAAAEEPEAVGLIFRAQLESVVHGLVLLYGTRADLIRLAGAHKNDARKLLEANDLDLDHVTVWPVEETRWPFEQIVRRAGVLLGDRGEHGDFGAGIYDAAYRSESTFGVHGLGPIMRHAGTCSSPTMILWDIDGSLPPPQALGLVAIYAGLLAQHVADSHQLDKSPIDDAIDAVEFFLS